MLRGTLPKSLALIFLTIICQDDSLLGLFRYSDMLKLSQVSKEMHQVLFKKTKSIKRVLRLGNLNEELRPKLWCKLINKDDLNEKLLQLTETSVREQFCSEEDSSLYEHILQSVNAYAPLHVIQTIEEENPSSRLTLRMRDEIEKDLNRTKTSQRC
jgi:hypothetical protein